MQRLISVLALTIASVSHADYYPAPAHRVFGEPHSKTDEKAINELMTDFRNAWSAQDAAGVAATHAHDAEWINAFGRTFRGTEELRSFLEKTLFPAFNPNVSMEEMTSLKEISRRYIGNDAAVINAQMDSSRGSSVGEGSRRVSLNLVLEEENGEWKIVHQIITDLRETRQPLN